MRRTSSFAFIVLLSLAIGSAAQPQRSLLSGSALVTLTAQARQEEPSAAEPSVDLPAPLQRVLTDYEQAWGKRDAAGLARLFTEDAFVLPNGRPPIRGRMAIEQYYTGHGGPLALRALAFAATGNVGYIIGAYAERKGDQDDGKFTLTLRKGSDGRWLIMSDMDSSNSRPPSR